MSHTVIASVLGLVVHGRHVRLKDDTRSKGCLVEVPKV